MIKKVKKAIAKPKKKPSPKKTHWRIIAALRRISTYHEPRLEVKAEAKKAPSLYACTKCNTLMYEGKSENKLKEYKKEFPKNNVEKGRLEIDHIVSVVGEEGFVDYNTYIERLFCGKDNLMALCPSCHKEKSAKENKERR
jgi:5-methylcytosine-specific restriction endonuclease McrA